MITALCIGTAESVEIDETASPWKYLLPETITTPVMVEYDGEVYQVPESME